MRLRFEIPWRVVSKKNRQKVVGNRLLPDDRVRADEDAIRAIAIAAVASEFGIARARAGAVQRVTEVAKLRRTPRSGVGPRALEKALAEIGRPLENPFGGRDVSVQVIEIVGREPADDRLEVIVRDDLEEAPPTRRTGKNHDLANVPALILDALQGRGGRAGVFDDDRQVVRLEAIRRYD